MVMAKEVQRMNQPLFGDSSVSKAVKELLYRIQDANPLSQSIYQQAATFFTGEEQLAIDALQQQKADLQRRIDDASKGARVKLEKRLLDTQNELKEKLRQQEDNRLGRIRQLKQTAKHILEAVTGDSTQETQQLSARMLGTIQLLSPTHGKNIAAVNQRHKHLYKAVLALRLLDQLLADQLIKNRYVFSKCADNTGNLFRAQVQLPLIMACLLQDIGLQHPEVKLILYGEDGSQDPYRILQGLEREQLLQICFAQSQRYVQEGLGLDTYVGNSKAERDVFVAIEDENQSFILHLLKSAIKPEDGIGNLLKIPQVYTSVVLPSKQMYQYEHLPKVSALLKAGAEKGWYPQAIVESLLKITGYFPQGFGITYIPKDSDKRDLDRYEYAIVNGLYPPEPEAPICRQVTRNLTFNSFGINLVISAENNLYFSTAQQKLEKVSEERLKEILSKLVSNFEERTSTDLIPKCWYPDEYFSYQKNQNLWNRTDTIRN